MVNDQGNNINSKTNNNTFNEIAFINNAFSQNNDTI